MGKKFLLLLIIFFGLNVFAWVKLITCGVHDICLDLKKIDGNTYYMLGRSFLPDNSDEEFSPSYMFLVKINKNGWIKWLNDFGKNTDLIGEKICVLSDGSCFIVGENISKHLKEIFILKIDKNGKIQWKKTIEKGVYVEANDIVQVDKQNFVLVGTIRYKGMSCSDVFVVKIDSTGNVVWKKHFGGFEVDVATSVVSVGNGDIVLAGYSFSYSDNFLADFLIARFDSKGNLLWKKTIGGKNNDKAYCIIKTSDGDFLVGGTTCSYITGKDGWDAYVCKIKSNGSILWCRNYGGEGQEHISSMTEMKDTSILLTGSTTSFTKGNSNDVWIFKISSTGNLLWNKVFGTKNIDGGDVILNIGNDEIVLGATFQGNARAIIGFFYIDKELKDFFCN